jgi:hypothetical protein
MDRFYLSDSVYQEKNQLYTEENGISNKIKNNNWHIKLNEYGWSKLSITWIKQLNKLNTIKEKNSLFGSLDCGENGDCLFHCISYAISPDLSYDAKQLRHDLSNYITDDDFNMIINYYKIFSLSGDFDENWNLKDIKIQDFKEKIKEGGNEYWGDIFMLNLLEKYLQINIIILNSNYDTNEHYYYPFSEYDLTKNSIILLYENNIHFQVIGHFQNGNMLSIFNHENIPKEILRLIKFLR